jgi:hypothetical protein
MSGFGLNLADTTRIKNAKTAKNTNRSLKLLLDPWRAAPE